MSSSELNVFDLDGTLYEFVGGSFSSSPLSDEVDRKAKRQVEIWLQDSDMGTEEFWSEVEKEYGEDISLAVEDLLGVDRYKYFNEVWAFDNPERFISDTYGDVLRVLEDPVIVVTGAPLVWAEEVLNYIDVGDQVAYLKTGEERPRKPSRDAFERPISKGFEQEFSRAWFIGDQASDFPDSTPDNVDEMALVYVGEGKPPREADYVLENIRGFPEVKESEAGY